MNNIHNNNIHNNKNFIPIDVRTIDVDIINDNKFILWLKIVIDISDNNNNDNNNNNDYYYNDYYYWWYKPG